MRQTRKALWSGDGRFLNFPTEAFPVLGAGEGKRTNLAGPAQPWLKLLQCGFKSIMRELFFLKYLKTTQNIRRKFNILQGSNT